MKMKYKILFMLFFLGLRGVAQEIEINLTNFSEIEVTRGLTVNLVPANENKAVIIGNSKEDVRVTVERGTLKVKSRLKQLLEADNTLVTIYFKNIQEIDARQNSKVEICSKIIQPLLKIKARQGSTVFANLEVENLVATAITGGQLTVIGKAEIQEIDVKAGGGFRGENLVSRNINVMVNGGGFAHVFARKYINATVRAGGHIYLYGNPEEIHEKITFGGSIKKIN